MFNSAKGRVVYRFIEIFVLSGAIGLAASPQFESWLPPVLTGVAAAIVKALRELLTQARIKKSIKANKE